MNSPAPWRYVKCDPMEDDDRGEVPLDYDPEDYIENPRIIDVDGKTVVGNGEYHVFGQLNRVDNVRLMLAAPDLLAVLQSFVAEQGEHQGLVSVGTYAAAVAAIEKATIGDPAASALLRREG